MAEMIKTNAMRILESVGISYTPHTYESDDGLIDGVSVAKKLGIEVEQVFKTLVTVAKSGSYYVFDIPVNAELNLKKAAAAVGEKSVEMIAVKDINKVTGYIRGGCSPIGMKKEYKTVIDETAILFDTICISAGKIGYQVELNPEDLAKLVNAEFVDITM